MPTVTFESIVRSLPGLVSYWPLGEAEPAEVVNGFLNPSFEHDSVGGAPAKWTVIAKINLSLEEAVVSEAWSSNGKKSFRIKFKHAANKESATGEVRMAHIPVGSEETLHLSATVNIITGANGGWRWFWSWFNSKEERISTGVSGTQLSGATGVHQITATVTTPAGAATAQLELEPICSEENAVVEFYVDEVTDKGTPYCDGDTPGYIWSGKAGESTTLKAPVAKDAVGTNNGEYTGGITLGEAGLLIGDTATAAKFDGSTGYVKVPHAPSLSPTGALTLGALVDPTASGTQKLIGGNINTVNLCPTPTFAGGIGQWKTKVRGGTVAVTPASTWHGPNTSESLLVKATVPNTGEEWKENGVEIAVGKCEGGKRFSFSVKLNVIAAPGAGSQLFSILSFYDAEGKTLGTFDGNLISAAGEAETHYLNGTIPAGATHAIFCLALSSSKSTGQAAEWYMDEIQIVESAAVPIYKDPTMAGYFWGGKAWESTTVLPYYALELVAQKLKVTLPIGTHGELTTLESPGTVELARGTLVVATFSGKVPPLLGGIYLYVDGAQVATRTVIGLLAETPEYLLLGNGLIGKQQYPFIGSQAISPAWVAYMHEIAVKGPLPVGARKTGFPDPVHKTGMIEVVY